MVLTLINFIILSFSFLGIVAIVVRKIPVLAEVPEKKDTRGSLFVSVQKIIAYNPLKRFSFIKFLQKILLAVERQTHLWVRELKEKTEKEKTALPDNYWHNLKKSTFCLQLEPKKRPIKKSATQKIKIKRTKKESKNAEPF